ncbi:MAG: translation elongation factor Ts [Mycoplasmatales bacterium]
MSIAVLIKELRDKTGAGMMDCKKALEASDLDVNKAVDWLRENGIAKAAKKGSRIAAEGLTTTKIAGNKAVIVELNSETDFVAQNDKFLALLETVTTALLNSDAKTLEEGLAVNVDGETIENIILNGTAVIGEKINLRRFEVISKTDDQSFATYSHLGGKISVLLLTNGENAEVSKGICMHIAAANPSYLSEDFVNADELAKERKMLEQEVIAEGKPEAIATKIVEGRIQKYLKDICLLDQDYVVDSGKSVREAAAAANLEIVGYNRYAVGEGIEKAEDNFAEEVASKMNV